MQKISAVISAFNEEAKIENCLKSVSWVDEIVVINNSSTDKTAEIAKKNGAKVYTQPNNPLLIDLQKNTGIKKSENNWILLVDADEIITEELKKEIQNLLKQNELKNGYYIPRKNIIFGKQIDYTGWYPDYQLRLFRKDRSEFKTNTVHKSITVEGETDYLKEHIIHNNYETIIQFLQKNMINYAQIQAESMLAENYKLKPSDLLEFPAKEFFSRFFARKGYKDGIHGLFLSLLLSASNLVVLAYVWEKQGFEKSSEKDVFKDLGKEFRKINKDTKYWMMTTKIEESKNPIKKVGYKVRRKI